MKTIPQICFVLCVVTSSCINEPAIKITQNEIAGDDTERLTETIEAPLALSENKVPAEQPIKELPLSKAQATVAVTPQTLQTVQKDAEAVFVSEISKKKEAAKTKFVKKVVRRAEIEFEEYLFDFGEIVQGDKVDHKFTFKNTGNAPLSITKADATCGCATPSIPFMDIMPGEVGYIGVNYNSMGKQGEESPQVTIFSNAGKNPNLVLKLNGYVKLPGEKTDQEVLTDSVKAAAIDSIKVEGSN